MRQGEGDLTSYVSTETFFILAGFFPIYLRYL